MRRMRLKRDLHLHRTGLVPNPHNLVTATGHEAVRDDVNARDLWVVHGGHRANEGCALDLVQARILSGLLGLGTSSNEPLAGKMQASNIIAVLRSSGMCIPRPEIRNPVRIRIRDSNRISNLVRILIFRGYQIFPEYEGNCLEITA